MSQDTLLLLCAFDDIASRLYRAKALVRVDQILDLFADQKARKDGCLVQHLLELYPVCLARLQNIKGCHKINNKLNIALTLSSITFIPREAYGIHIKWL